MRRTLFSLTALLVAALVCASPATAKNSPGIQPLKKSLPAIFTVVPDGTDLYSLIPRTTKIGRNVRFDFLLFRESFRTTERVRLMRFKGDDDAEPYIDEMVAGGGYAALTLSDDVGFEPGYSSVFRVSRDGSTKELLASGRPLPGGIATVVIEEGMPRRNDCGTSVAGVSMSTTGAVVIQELTADRESVACGRKQNIDHWRTYEVAVSGATREIFKLDRRLPDVPTSLPKGGFPIDPDPNAVPPPEVPGMVKVVGDLALFQRSTNGPVYVRDLRTDILSGPFGTGWHGKKLWNEASINPSGNIAMNSIKTKPQKNGTSQSYTRAGVFATPLNPSSFTELKQAWSIEYCGSHLVADVKDDFVELDPVTFKRKRLITKYPANAFAWETLQSCNEDYYYALRWSHGAPKALAYPLG